MAYHIPGMPGGEGWPALCPYLLAPLGCENHPGDHTMAWRHCPLGDWQLDPEGMGSVSRVCRPGCHPVSSTSGNQGPLGSGGQGAGGPLGQALGSWVWRKGLQPWMWGAHDPVWREGLGRGWIPDFSCPRSTSVQPSVAARGPQEELSWENHHPSERKITNNNNIMFRLMLKLKLHFCDHLM